MTIVPNNYYVNNADFLKALKDYKQACIEAKEAGKEAWDKPVLSET